MENNILSDENKKEEATSIKKDYLDISKKSLNEQIQILAEMSRLIDEKVLENNAYQKKR